MLIPGLDPGTYSVLLDVEDTIAIGELNVLAESAAVGAAAALPDAVSEALGDSLVAIFYFDDVGKEWSFYDPRPEFSRPQHPVRNGQRRGLLDPGQRDRGRRGPE